MKILLFLSVLLCSISLAAPSLQITKLPVTPIYQPTGPVEDAYAQQGQWFLDPTTGLEVRSHEFHDNVHPGWGGGIASWHAIHGYVSSVITNGFGEILSFEVLASITNDTPALSAWLAGANSHSESRAFTDLGDQYIGTLKETKLTVEFALVSEGMLPIPILPYRDITPPYIIAENEDQSAWYCWCPTNDLGWLPGEFFVPTWDFGDIPPGAGASRTLQFSFSIPLPEVDMRYAIIMMSKEMELDILMNRTTSLKISDWIEDLGIDDGTPYPTEPLTGSDCSVFHNIPEPLSSSLVLLVLLLFLKKR